MRRLLTLFLTLYLLGSLAACGVQTPLEEAPAPESPTPEVPAPENPTSEIPAPEVPAGPDKGYTIYNCGGIEIALPTEYLDQLIVDTEFSDVPRLWKPLISVYERASAEAAEAEWSDRSGMGFLFGLVAMDRVGVERYLCEDIPGMKIIAVKGERYYAQTFPTDVRFYRPGGAIDTESADWETWETLSRIGAAAAADMIRRNSLTPYESTEFFSRSFTWEGAHAYFRFCHRGDGNYAYSEATRYVLVLSQPVRQGEGGIWCLDRWMYEDGDPMIYFPDSGLPAAEYYARLQTACDSGEHPELLTPAGAAAAFVEDYFGIEPAPEDLQLLDGSEEARAIAKFRLGE